MFCFLQSIWFFFILVLHFHRFPLFILIAKRFCVIPITNSQSNGEMCFWKKTNKQKSKKQPNKKTTKNNNPPTKKNKTNKKRLRVTIDLLNYQINIDKSFTLVFLSFYFIFLANSRPFETYPTSVNIQSLCLAFTSINHGYRFLETCFAVRQKKPQTSVWLRGAPDTMNR